MPCLFALHDALSSRKPVPCSLQPRKSSNCSNHCLPLASPSKILLLSFLSHFCPSQLCLFVGTVHASVSLAIHKSCWPPSSCPQKQHLTLASFYLRRQLTAGQVMGPVVVVLLLLLLFKTYLNLLTVRVCKTRVAWLPNFGDQLSPNEETQTYMLPVIETSLSSTFVWRNQK